MGAGLQRGEQFRMGHADPVAVPWRRIQVQPQPRARPNGDAAGLEPPEAELGTLQVGQDGQGPLDLGLRRAHGFQGRGVIVVSPVAEVEAEHVGPGPGQGQHLVRRAAGGAEGGDDAGAASADHLCAVSRSPSRLAAPTKAASGRMTTRVGMDRT